MPGLFPIIEDINSLYRDFRRMPPVEVSEELRGWSYGQGVVAPPGGPLLGVSDITGGFCDRGRDVYLRYVKRVQPRDNYLLQRGRLIHETWTRTIVEVKRSIYNHGLDASSQELANTASTLKEKLRAEFNAKHSLVPEEERTWLVDRIINEGFSTYASSLERQLSRSRFLEIDGLVAATVPLLTEYPINGEKIGLSRALRVDALIPPGLILELKTRHPRREFELALVGYALAFESEYETPIDRGLLMYVEVDPPKRRLYVRPRIIALGDALRSEFVERRDKLLELILYDEDPGVSSNCPSECPYIHYCRGGE
ncbi:type I-A CRISPR-associated protein Cas4/Csa1 [Infirmifilum sp.]|uniref:type I-A CRISPR-associated protein Cas4/Csa1 n=1 Tax=Infirmifilum sp. TaxID=2856575 RepID=UPI003D1427C8